MKITFQANEFKKALDAAMDACPGRPVAAAHGCVHLKACMDREGFPCVILSCQDGALEIRRWLRCDVQEQGEALIQARLLRDYVSVLSGEATISFSVGAAKCTLSSGKKKMSIACMQPEEYVFDALDKDISLFAAFNSDSLSRFVGSCSHCAGTDMSRLALTGLLIELSGSTASATCTNGFTFAHIEVPATVYQEGSLLLPVVQLQKATKLLGSSKTPIAVQGGRSLCRMEGDCAQITFSLLSAPYIDYRRLMHTDAPTNVSVNCKDLLSAVKQCAIAAADGQKGAVAITVDNQVLTVRASSSNSDCVAPVDCANWGVPIQASFNARYLVDALDRAVRESDQVTLLFKGPISPCAIIPEVEDADKPFAPYFLVLPVRTHTVS